MRTILIDPVERSFTEVNYDGDFRSIYTHLGCDLFDVVYTDLGDIYVDDEGLLKSPQKFFHIEGLPSPLAGRGLVFGPVDEEGNSTEATVSIDELEKKVRFMSAPQVLEMFA
jgi:hypothetical protein